MDFYVLPRVDELLVEDRVNGRVYRSTAENFVQHRIQINRGAGPQYVLPLAYWEVVQERGRARTPQGAAAAPAADTGPPAPGADGQPRLL